MFELDQIIQLLASLFNTNESFYFADRPPCFILWCRSGANVVAALRIAQRLGAKATVVTIIVDSGLRYLSMDTYR